MNIFQLPQVDARGRAVASEQSITAVWFGLDGSVTLVSIPSSSGPYCSGWSGASALGRGLPLLPTASARSRLSFYPIYIA